MMCPIGYGRSAVGRRCGNSTIACVDVADTAALSIVASRLLAAVEAATPKQESSIPTSRGTALLVDDEGYVRRARRVRQSTADMLADLARTLRSERGSIPVLIISGYAETEGIEPDLSRLTKPFRRDELANSRAALKNRSVLERSRATS